MDTPVLLVCFNRPELTKRLVDCLVQTNAQRVYVAVDGPRENNPNDQDNCHSVQEIIDSAPWPGVVLKRYQDSNLGCRRGVSHAIDWFFSHEQEGIILEDDCLPDPTFFEFCTTLIAEFRENPRIGAISGTTYFPLSSEGSYSYGFSKYPLVWGWATWKRAWEKFDHELLQWAGTGGRQILDSVSDESTSFVRTWSKILDAVKMGKIDSWAYIWSFSSWSAGMLTVIPRVNLVSNLGFDNTATHTSRKPLTQNFRPRALTMPQPIQHPPLIEPDMKIDFLTRQLITGIHGKSIRSLARILWSVGLIFRSRSHD